ncbi:FHA domain protein [Poriferisphaera corsica]|uniref:FHA domain protein n=1 Tax=Poriferisphaera corsica TaxID=2528020 RepID=A0A517YV08_9BACT|nr:FHA domain-containing protein [Poriferisphaera corsica]QDU34040.1 FHA domain protein [Poriferisphaera corsica]
MPDIPSVQIRLLIGPQAGRVVTLQQSPISFGRALDNTICLDIETLSRKHGEFLFTNNLWHFTNHSPNGTRINNKKISNQPFDFFSPIKVKVGRDVLFELEPLSHAEQASTATQNGSEPEVEKSSAKRIKLFSILGSVYAAALLALVLILSSLSSSDSTMGNTKGLNITETAIRQELFKNHPKETPNPRQVAEFINHANERLALKDSEPEALYDALRALRKAQAYTDQRTFSDPIYNRLLTELQESMTKRLSDDMQQAYLLLTSRKYQAAIDHYNAIERYYPANNQSSIYRTLQKNLATAIRGREQRK